MAQDLYSVTTQDIKEPPKTFWDRLRHLGPGIIMSASIVGSGELIMTTTLGARAGYVTLWVILVSCLVKVIMQLEFGKHTIYAGVPALQSINRFLPGLRVGPAHWTVYGWWSIQGLKLFQMGGIIGGVGQALAIMFPVFNVATWAIITGTTCTVLVAMGGYKFIERMSLSLLTLFTLFTLVCVIALQWTSYAIQWPDIASGFTFQLPAAALGVALAAFGITGAGADEIMAYTYWCVEKGYARFTGPRDDSPVWFARARGWIRVMYLDALVSMVIYTVTTAAFYILGAAVLHGRGEIPQGYEMISTLSLMYTESLGSSVQLLFLTGAVIVLFSTLFSAMASWTRTWMDALAQLRLINFQDVNTRSRTIVRLAIFFGIVWTSLFLFYEQPVYMVMMGGLATAALLLLVTYVAFVYRYRLLPRELGPGKFYDAAFWISAFSIAGVGIKAIVEALS
jgi:manganese transport protein